MPEALERTTSLGPKDGLSSGRKALTREELTRHFLLRAQMRNAALMERQWNVERQFLERPNYRNRDFVGGDMELLPFLRLAGVESFSSWEEGLYSRSSGLEVGLKTSVRSVILKLKLSWQDFQNPIKQFIYLINNVEL